MSKKNKIYWSLGVTEMGTRALLTDENSKFKWLRSQRNRRVLVLLNLLGLVLVSLGSYYQNQEIDFNVSTEIEILIFSVIAVFVIFLTLGSHDVSKNCSQGDSGCTR